MEDGEVADEEGHVMGADCRPRRRRDRAVDAVHAAVREDPDVTALPSEHVDVPNRPR